MLTHLIVTPHGCTESESSVVGALPPSGRASEQESSCHGGFGSRCKRHVRQIWARSAWSGYTATVAEAGEL